MTDPLRTYHSLGCRLTVQDDSSVLYRYATNDGVYEFDTYRQIAEPFKHQFDNLIEAEGLVIERNVEISKAPWLVDVVTACHAVR